MCCSSNSVKSDWAEGSSKYFAAQALPWRPALSYCGYRRTNFDQKKHSGRPRSSKALVVASKDAGDKPFTRLGSLLDRLEGFNHASMELPNRQQHKLWMRKEYLEKGQRSKIMPCPLDTRRCLLSHPKTFLHLNICIFICLANLGDCLEDKVSYYAFCSFPNSHQFTNFWTPYQS